MKVNNHPAIQVTFNNVLRGHCTGLINDVKGVFEEPQVQHLGIVKDVVSLHHGPQKMVGQPVQLTRTPSTIARSAPKRGEHSEEILREIGLEADELASLKAKGVY